MERTGIEPVTSGLQIQSGFAFGTKGAPRYRCRDDRDCQDYQLKTGKYAEPS
jgi:hypothetical protein